MLGQQYELRLAGVRSDTGLALTLTLHDAAGNQLGTSAVAFDASPLAGNHFGFRNRIAGANHLIDASFDNFNVFAPLTLPGDYNRDGHVDAADYAVWRDNFGKDTTLANDDTAGVELDDYSRWKARFGQTSSGASKAAALPEPRAGVLLVAFGLTAIAGSRPKWRV